MRTKIAMMREIKESDRKILQQLHSQALERFCKQILVEIERVNSGRAKGFHRKYPDICEVIDRRDKEMAQTFNNLRRSGAFMQIASLKARGLLTEDEFLRFSQDTRDAVDLLLGAHNQFVQDYLSAAASGWPWAPEGWVSPSAAASVGAKSMGWQGTAYVPGLNALPQRMSGTCAS